MSKVADRTAPLPQVAGGLVINTDGDVLLVNQAGTSWSLPKGHVEDGESLLDAARREILEESGLSELTGGEPLTTYERTVVLEDGSIDATRRKRISLFAFRAGASRGPLAPRDSHNPEARWVPPALVAQFLTHPSDRAAYAAVGPGAGDGDLGRLVRAAIPDCPEEIVARFLDLRDLPARKLAALAVLDLRKPYGSNRIIAADGEAGLSFATLLPGEGSSFHFHRRRQEAFLVRNGTLTLVRGDCEFLLRPGEVGCSHPGQPHAIANRGDEPLELIEVFAPPLLDDKVRVRDTYGRALGEVTRDE